MGILVHDHKGLAALGRLDELGICEAYMTGSLDVGGGWGSFTEHAGRRGIQVTALTISHQSEQFLMDLVERIQLPARVLNQDFLMYDSPEPFDAIVILGVMEHRLIIPPC